MNKYLLMATGGALIGDGLYVLLGGPYHGFASIIAGVFLIVLRYRGAVK